MAVFNFKMADSSSSHELPRHNGDEMLELNKDLERMIEDVENMSVIFQMENSDKITEQGSAAACADLENILKGLDSLSNCMDQLALQTQLKLCDLIVCVGCSDMPAFLKNPRGTEAAASGLT